MIARLSSPVGDIKDHYEVVVIGSGYGGVITASRDVPQALGIQFTETMKGYISTQIADYQAAAERGKADGSPPVFFRRARSRRWSC